MKLDRMFRDASDALNTINHWEDNNTKFSIIDYGGMAMSTASPMGKMIFTMLAGFAEFERNMIRERITQSMQYKRKNGKKFGPAPYGYDEVALSDGTKSLVPNPVEKKWIQWMKDKRKANWSFGHISQWLNDNNIPTKRTGTWSKSGVKYVVENDLHDTV
jgi:DNA invertase Pin-like site-specific DNA recombinase